jgi:hypothetical protein
LYLQAGLPRFPLSYLTHQVAHRPAWLVSSVCSVTLHLPWCYSQLASTRLKKWQAATPHLMQGYNLAMSPKGTVATIIV